MVFSSFSRSEINNQVVFKNTNPIKNVGAIRFFADDAGGPFSKKEFRWSFNNSYWSSWEVLNQGNISRLDSGGKPYLFIEVRYVKASDTSSVNTFSITYDEFRGTVPAPMPSQPSQQSVPCPTDYSGSCTPQPAPDDCTILSGKSGEYYLWRPNHQGEQPISTITGLQDVLRNLANAVQNVDIQGAANVDASGVGVYYNKQDKLLYFKRIVGGKMLFVNEDTAGRITISIDDSSINDIMFHLGNLSGVNVGGADGQVYRGRVGDNLQFRTIAPLTSGVSVVTVGDQVRIGLDASITGETVWSDTDPVSATVGGMDSGTLIQQGSNAISILENILYEYFPPDVSIMSTPSPGYYEKWDPTTLSDVSVYGNFNNEPFAKVRVTDVSFYSSLVGGIGNIQYMDVSNGVFEFNDGGTNSNWDDVVYSIHVHHNVSGHIVDPYEVSVGIQFVNPYIWGIVGDEVTIGNVDHNILENLHSLGQKIICPKQSNLVNFVRPNGMVKVKFLYAYDATYGELSSILDTKNNFSVTTSFSSTIVNINLGVQTNIPYRVYIKNHWIDVQTFSLLFNI